MCAIQTISEIPLGSASDSYSCPVASSMYNAYNVSQISLGTGDEIKVHWHSLWATLAPTPAPSVPWLACTRTGVPRSPVQPKEMGNFWHATIDGSGQHITTTCYPILYQYIYLANNLVERKKRRMKDQRSKIITALSVSRLSDCPRVGAIASSTSLRSDHPRCRAKDDLKFEFSPFAPNAKKNSA